GDGSLQVDGAAGTAATPPADPGDYASTDDRAGLNGAEADGALQDFSDRQGSASDNADIGDGDRADLTGAWTLDRNARGGSDEGDADRAQEQLPANDVTLRELLKHQLAGARCTRRDKALLHLLIEELHDDGYLRTDLTQ